MGIKLYKEGVGEVAHYPAVGRPVASEADAAAGTNNSRQMTPLRTAQAIAALGGGSAPAIASQSEAEAGTDNVKMMTPLRTAQAIAALAPDGGGGVSSIDVSVSTSPLELTSGQTAASTILLTGARADDLDVIPSAPGGWIVVNQTGRIVTVVNEVDGDRRVPISDNLGKIVIFDGAFLWSGGELTKALPIGSIAQGGTGTVTLDDDPPVPPDHLGYANPPGGDCAFDIVDNTDTAIFGHYPGTGELNPSSGWVVATFTDNYTTVDVTAPADAPVGTYRVRTYYDDGAHSGYFTVVAP